MRRAQPLDAYANDGQTSLADLFFGQLAIQKVQERDVSDVSGSGGAEPERRGIASIFDQPQQGKADQAGESRLVELNGVEDMVAAEAQDRRGQTEFRHVEFEPGAGK